MEVIRLHALLVGLVLIVLSIHGICAYTVVSEITPYTESQILRNTRMLNMARLTLEHIEEGQTLLFTPTNHSDLDDIISVTTTEVNAYLHLDSDIDRLNTYYSLYNIEVKFDTVPVGSIHSTGETACMLTLASLDCHFVTLDVSGDWTFDFEITTTAGSVSDNAETVVLITVTIQDQ